jgi:hypothetical protein
MRSINMQLYLLMDLIMEQNNQSTCIHSNQKREIGITKAAASVEKTV